jgi:hypothetical protein
MTFAFLFVMSSTHIWFHLVPLKTSTLPQTIENAPVEFVVFFGFANLTFPLVVKFEDPEQVTMTSSE